MLCYQLRPYKAVHEQPTPTAALSLKLSSRVAILLRGVSAIGRRNSEGRKSARGRKEVDAWLNTGLRVFMVAFRKLTVDEDTDRFKRCQSRDPG